MALEVAEYTSMPTNWRVVDEMARFFPLFLIMALITIRQFRVGYRSADLEVLWAVLWVQLMVALWVLPVRRFCSRSRCTISLRTLCSLGGSNSVSDDIGIATLWTLLFANIIILWWWWDWNLQASDCQGFLVLYLGIWKEKFQASTESSSAMWMHAELRDSVQGSRMIHHLDEPQVAC